MNWHRYRSIQLLLSNAASASDCTLPSILRCLLPSATLTFEGQFAHSKKLSSSTTMHFSSKTIACLTDVPAPNPLPPLSTNKHSSYEVLDVQTCFDVPAFVECLEYLETKLCMPFDELKLKLARISWLGVAEGGRTYIRSRPDPPSITEVRGAIRFLESIPGIDVTRAVRNLPFVLSHPAMGTPLATAARADHLERELDLRPGELGKLLSANVHCVMVDAAATVDPCIEFLRGLEFDPGQVRSIVLRYPRVLSVRVERLQAGVQTLRNVGMNEMQIKSAVYGLPSILATSVEKIKSCVAWLRAHGLATQAEIASTLARFPAIVSYNLAGNLTASIEFLRKEAQLDDLAVARVLQYAPDVLGRTADRLRASLTALRDAGMTEEHLMTLLSKNPNVLKYDVSRPPYSTKLTFLRESLQRDLASTLATHPMYLSYGMDRIASRAAFLQVRFHVFMNKDDCNIMILNSCGTRHARRTFGLLSTFVLLLY
jgi:hypothetical protein